MIKSKREVLPARTRHHDDKRSAWLVWLALLFIGAQVLDMTDRW